MLQTGTTEDESLRALANFRALWTVDIGGRAQDAFQTQATPHSFVIQNDRVVAQTLGSNIEGLLDVERWTPSAEQAMATLVPVSSAPETDRVTR
jgi:hypothetical protein